MKKFMKKRGIGSYLSWILIVSMVIVISAFMINWTLERVKKTSHQIEKSTDELLCREVGINIQGICQNSKILNMNISNVGNIKIDRIQIRMISMYDDPETKEVDISLYPGDFETGFTVLKQGTLQSVKLIPLIKTEDEEIICPENSIEKQKIEQC
ncbi:MAG: hypothetical protein KKF44_06735 [Nanoarchaeota archaeon]|nr:hypothetical protein [Nanoarchaeota archaeon]